MKMKRLTIALLFSASVVVASGCKQDDTITSYHVSKEHPTVTAERGTDQPQDRMLAAMIPHGEKTWFFKVTGPADALASQAESFKKLIGSVQFTAAGTSPEWTLPADWQQRPASGMRFATIVIGGEDKPLELSVIPLPSPPQDPAGYALSNINRWRGQLGLPPIAATQLTKETEQLKLDGVTATLVNLKGHMAGQQGMMGQAPFASGQQGLPPRPSSQGPASSGTEPSASAIPQTSATGSQASASPLTFDQPETWQAGKVGGMRKAAFTVADGDKHVEITVIDLAEAAGELLPNINRWRGQLKLPPVEQAELDKQLQPIKAGQVAGHFIELIGAEANQPQQAMLGAVIVDAGKAWFFKLTGDAELVKKEKPRFRAFVESTRFR